MAPNNLEISVLITKIKIYKLSNNLADNVFNIIL